MHDPMAAVEGLPQEGWAVAPCHELCDPRRALTYGVIKLGESEPQGVPTLRTSDVRPLRINEDGIKRIAPAIAAEYSRTKLEGGELVVSVRGTLGGVAVVPAHMRGYNVSREVAVVPLAEPHCPHFFAYAVARQSAQNWLTGKARGVAYTGINIEDLRELPLPVAPLAEQKRIVAKVEELLAQVNAARERLRRVPEILKRVRQSVLAAGCSGELTGDWRELATSEAMQGQELAQSLLRAHAREGIGHGGKSADPTDEVHNLSLAHLPPGWGLVPLQLACVPGRSITYGILKPGPDVPDGVPYVRVADFPNGAINLPGVKRTSASIASEYRRASLKAGDLLLSIRGTAGRVCMVPQELDGGNITQDTARISVHPSLSNEFVALALRSPGTQRRIQRAMKGVAVRGINIGDVRVLQLPLPGLAEQAEIVRRVHALLALADRIEERVAAATARVDRLTQAILAKAFRGELVPTEAELARREGRDYETAEALLERVRAEFPTSMSPRRKQRTHRGSL